MAIACGGLGQPVRSTRSSRLSTRVTAYCSTASAATRGQRGCARSWCRSSSTFPSWRHPAVLSQCGGSDECSRSACHTYPPPLDPTHSVDILCGPRPPIDLAFRSTSSVRFSMDLAFRSTSLSDRRLVWQAAQFITKAYRLTLAFRSTSSVRPSPSGTLVCLFVVIVMHYRIPPPRDISFTTLPVEVGSILGVVRFARMSCRADCRWSS